ncbi:hypothetical protein [Clostridiisalibacter paucivorans]|uniref:hypothetical protein n=1 Tax=Clostridiisalibacter paucivorans TaxID=408753 RepID=UPI00047CF116|nr:hypothetical protein [Clostridiisalibacter paucivorans]
MDYNDIIEYEKDLIEKVFEFTTDTINKEGWKDIKIFSFNGIDETHREAVMNYWFILDYVTPNGKRFIELFIEKYKDSLNDEELYAYESIRESFLSLYEILEIKGEYVYVKDLILNEERLVRESSISKEDIKPGYIKLSRIAHVKGNTVFFGIDSYLYPSVKDEFISLIMDMYKDISDEQGLTIEEFLKRYSYILYKAYDYFYTDYMDEEDMDAYNEDVEDIIEDFGDFMINVQGISEKTSIKHMKVIRGYYDYFLHQEDAISDFNEDTIVNFIEWGIDDGYFISKNDLLQTITSVRKYAKYLNIKDIIDKHTYNDILRVTKDKDYYLDIFYSYEDEKDCENVIVKDFSFDQGLERIFEKHIDNKKINIVNDYINFLTYIKEHEVKLTKINKFINRENIISLNNIMTNPEVLKSAPNQIDVLLIHLFYLFSIDKDIFHINGELLELGEKYNEYIKFSCSKKASLFLIYIWKECDWKRLVNDDFFNDTKEYNNRNAILEHLADLKPGMIYNYKEVINAFVNVDIEKIVEDIEDVDDIFEFIYENGNLIDIRMTDIFNSKITYYFNALGIFDIEYTKKLNHQDVIDGEHIYTIKMNKLGIDICKYLTKGYNREGNVIYLSDKF